MMNTLAKATMATVLSVLLIGCDNGEKKAIEHTAYQYALATSNYQLDEAAPYATSETLNTTFIMAERLVQAVGEDYVKSDTPAQIEILSSAMVNDTEAYAVYHKTTPIKDFADTLHLKKRDGKWLVHCPVPKKKAPAPQTDNADSNILNIKHINYDKLSNDASGNLK